MFRACLLAGAALALSTVALADEQRIHEKDVPKPVIEAVKKKYPSAKLGGFSKETEDGKLVYEVRVAEDGRSIEVECSPEGKILAEEERIAEDALPKEVKAALVLSKFGRWHVRKAEKVVKDEKTDDPSFELVVADGDRVFEVVFDKTGKITKEERKERRGEESLSWDAFDAARKKYPKARLVEFEREHGKGGPTIELRLVDGTRDISVVVSATSGKIVKEEETVEADSLPKEVKAGIEGSKYARWKIQRAERVIRDENAADPTYEVVLGAYGRRVEVVLDKTGKLTEVEHGWGGPAIRNKIRKFVESFSKRSWKHDDDDDDED